MYANLPEGYARNKQPCGFCAWYHNDRPLGSRCGKFHHAVSPTDHVIYQSNEPCYVIKLGELPDQRFVPTDPPKTLGTMMRSLWRRATAPSSDSLRRP